MRDEIRKQIESLLDSGDHNFSDDEPLVTSGKLSSLKIVEFASWLEKAYKMDFSARSFNIYDFETVNSIVDMVRSQENS